MANRIPNAAVQDAEAERRAACIRAAEKRYAEMLKARRRLFGSLGIWQICPEKPCTRARACRGDIHICTRERWPIAVPEDFKAFLFKAIRFRLEGANPADAVRLAEEDMEKHRTALTRLEASGTHV